MIRGRVKESTLPNFKRRVLSWLVARLVCDSAPPADAQNVVERWNYPRGNIGKMAIAFVLCFVVGMTDAAIGVNNGHVHAHLIFFSTGTTG